MGIWVISNAAKFNITRDPKYLGASGLIMLDCDAGTTALAAAVIFDTDSAVINKYVIPKDDWVFVPIELHSPQMLLYDTFCRKHPAI
jgi:hypothetical protein